jgi:signal transduction histidine kinase
MGWTLFLAVQLVDFADLNGGDWRITTPIYIAYSALAISVGWLSEQLHVYYKAAIEGERVAVVRQLAIAIQHEARNALAAIRAETQLLATSGRLEHPEDQKGLRTIRDMSARIGKAVDRLATVSHAPVTDYLPGQAMVDLARIPPEPRAAKP